MAGACLRAVANRSRTRLAPTPTNISMKSRTGDREERHARFARDGAREHRLSGARRSDEQDALRDQRADLFVATGVFKNSTISLISCLTPKYPATSAKVVFGRSWLNCFALERPTDIMPVI